MKYSNNPFNIRYVKNTHWRGQIEPKNGFCQFDNLYHGVRAWMYLMCVSYLRHDRDMTLSQMIERYAPASDGNNTFSYQCQVYRYLRCAPNTPLRDIVANDKLLIRLGHIMSIVETGFDAEFATRVCIKVYKPEFPKL